MPSQSVANFNVGSTVSDTCPMLPIDQFVEAMGRASLVATGFSYQKDEEIFGQDEPAEYVYQIVRGAVRTYKLLSDGRRQIGSFHLAGDIFGLEYGASHRLTAEALVETDVRLIRRRSLEVAAVEDAQVARSLWHVTAGKLQHAEDHMLLLGCKNALEKVAAFLLEMDDRLLAAGLSELPMCRRDIGDYLGLTLETVSRALASLHDQGILNFAGARQILIRNRKRLSDLNS